MGNFRSVTQSALLQSDYLVEEGYAHNNYDRFQTIKAQKVGFDEIITYNKMQSLMDKIIAIQARREVGVLKQLGMGSLKQLNKTLFTDEGINESISTELEELYNIICDGARAGIEGQTYRDFKREGTISGQELQQGLDKVMKRKMNKMSKDYEVNFDKILTTVSVGDNNTQVSAVRSDLLSTFNTLKKEKDIEHKDLYDISQRYFAQWKSNATKHAFAYLMSQFDKVKNVTITKNEYDAYGREAKSKMTIELDNGKDFGFSFANRKLASDNHIAFALQNGGKDGTSFGTFVNRLRSLKSLTGNGMINDTINDIANGLTTKNFYYNLVNEALHKTTFKKSEPVVEFLEIVKNLAAAWFGAQLVTDTQESSGQNVDFFLISGVGLVPMSKLLKLVQEEGNKIYVSVISNVDIDEDAYHEEKIIAGMEARRPLAYGPEVREVGTEMGEKIYEDIDVNEIKLNLLLSRAQSLTTYK